MLNPNEYPIQVRSEELGVRQFKTLQDALSYAQDNRSVWKISFEIIDGTRVRLVREDNQWIYESINGMRN